MPKGKLYFKSALTSGWVDAWERYGLGLEDGSLSNLIAPAPLKKPVSNSNALKHGIACLEDSIGKKDSKSVSLEIHLCAKSARGYEKNGKMTKKGAGARPRLTRSAAGDIVWLTIYRATIYRMTKSARHGPPCAKRGERHG